MKFALIINPQDASQTVIHSLAELNYSVSCAPLPFDLQNSRLNHSMSFIHPKLKALSDIKSQMSQCLKMIKEKNISFILPSCSINGGQYLIIGCLNEMHGLPGLDKKLSKFWMRKSRYLRHFKQLGLNAPSIFQTVSTQEEPNLDLITDFPVICKPDCGSGSRGVFLARTSKELEKLFQPDFDEAMELEKQPRSKLTNKNLASYLYDNCHSKYLIEKFIPGPLFCITGIKAVNGIEVSLLYQVMPSDPPFRSENEFLAPLPFSEKEHTKKIHSLTSQIIKDSVFPYGPFVLDCILSDNKELYLLDASPRLNGLPIDFLKLCYSDDSYVERAIRALLNQKIEIQKRKEPIAYIYLKNLPLPKGRLIKFYQREPFSDYVVDWKFNLHPGNYIFKERNDAFSKYRGHLALAGANIQQAKNRWFQEYDKLKFSIKSEP